MRVFHDPVWRRGPRHASAARLGAKAAVSGSLVGMSAIEIGLRELQRRPSAVIERIEHDEASAIVTRHGRPIAVLLPIDRVHAWVLQNRPLGDDVADDETFWDVEDGVRIAPDAVDLVADLPDQMRRRLFTALRKLRRLAATGRIAISVGRRWALVDLEHDSEPTLLDVARRAKLERWLHGGREDRQPR